MHVPFLQLDNDGLLEVAAHFKFYLAAYLDGACLDYNSEPIQLYDGTRIDFEGEYDLSSPIARDIFERSFLLFMNDIYLLADRRGLTEQIAQIWGTDGLAHVMIADNSKKASNCNLAPKLG